MSRKIYLFRVMKSSINLRVLCSVQHYFESGYQLRCSLSIGIDGNQGGSSLANRARDGSSPRWFPHAINLAVNAIRFLPVIIPFLLFDVLYFPRISIFFRGLHFSGKSFFSDSLHAVMEVAS